MISLLAVFLIVVVLVLTLMQTLLVIKYRWFHRDAPNAIEDAGAKENLPKAAIILCLRGQNESTPDCIAELIGQDYSDYELHIAFDSPDDPAAKQVEEFFENHRYQPKLHFFTPLPECSYKCSGIVHILEQLDSEIEIVAFCDGDAVVDVNWLSDLVLPMTRDQQIGATTGNRWYVPFDNSIGGLVRKHWNAAAVVQMQAYDIAWGGSMAVRKSTIDKCELGKIWSATFCEDTVLTKAIEKHGLRLHRVPNLVIENMETSTLQECYDWIARQLLTVRLHHPGWPLVLGHGVATGIATIVVPILAILLLMTGYLNEGRSLLLAWFIYQVLNFVLLLVIDRCNRSAISQRASADPVTNPPSSRSGLFALIAVQILHPLAVLKAYSMKVVTWSGISYAVDGNKIRVKN